MNTHPNSVDKTVLHSCNFMGAQYETSPVQILAHHPDFPTRQDAAEDGVAVYQPFSRMLQFALEPLILAASGSEHAEPPGEADLSQAMAGGLLFWEYSPAQDDLTSIPRDVTPTRACIFTVVLP